ncbi:hypothetical protein B0H13DRAFT_1927462 [Mycena leptocephala]|nr:hypothetical protein B0H13DRAFT_1927462 [Mycena leptocephala]
MPETFDFRPELSAIFPEVDVEVRADGGRGDVGDFSERVTGAGEAVDEGRRIGVLKTAGARNPSVEDMMDGGADTVILDAQALCTSCASREAGSHAARQQAATDGVGWAGESRGARGRDGGSVYGQERQHRMLRVRLVARDGAKVYASVVSSARAWHSVENDIAPATSRAVHMV